MLEAPQAEARESICGKLFISVLIYISPLLSGKQQDQEKEQSLLTKDRQISPNQGALPQLPQLADGSMGMEEDV